MKNSKLRKSRDGWKTKATRRGTQLRNSKKASKRKQKRSASVAQHDDKICRLQDEVISLEKKGGRSPGSVESCRHSRTAYSAQEPLRVYCYMGYCFVSVGTENSKDFQAAS